MVHDHAACVPFPCHWIIPMRPTLLALAAAALFVSLPAHAQQGGPEDPRGWSAGIGAAWSPSAYRSYRNRAWPVPTFAYEGERFFVRGPGVGYRLVDGNGFDLNAVVSLHPQRYRAKDARDAQLRQLDDRDFSAVAGLDARWRGPWGTVGASLKTDVTGHGGGLVGDLNYAYPLPSGRVTWIPIVGVEYASADMNDYYYGIDAREAARSGLDRYQAGSSLSPYVSISARIQVTPRWTATVGVRALRLDGEVTDSPMVGRSTATGYLASLNYDF